MLNRRVTLRDEVPEDKAFLYRLYASTREAEMNMVPWPQEQKDEFLKMQFELQTAHYRQHFADASFQIIFCDGDDAGRLCVHRTRHEIRVVDIALLPEFRNAGIATKLLNELADEGGITGRKITMHVLRESPALRLYQRLGFTVTEDKGVYLFVEWNPSAVPKNAVGEEVSANL